MNILVVLIGLVSAVALLFSMEAFRTYPLDPQKGLLKRGFSLMGLGLVTGGVAVTLFVEYVV